MTCTTTPQKLNRGQWASLPDEEKLRLMEAGAQLLALGEVRAEVRHGDYYVEYHPGNVTFLKSEIARLRSKLGMYHGFSIGRRGQC